MTQKYQIPRRPGAVTLAALAALTTVAGAGTASACAPEAYIGSVCFTAARFCPDGYLPTDGRIMPINNNQALYSLLGNTYGGDGRTTFALPDLRGRSPVGTTTATTSGGTSISAIILGQLRGQETSTLQTANLPPAGSSGGPAQVSATTNQGTTNVPSSTVQLAAAASTYGRESITTNIYAPIGGPQVALGGVSGGGSSAGGTSAPFTNLPPQIGLTACIAVQGLYPPQPN